MSSSVRSPMLPPRDIALVLVIVVAWAANILTSALALRELPPLLYTALRFALLALSAMLEPGGFAMLREASWVVWFGAAFAAFAASLLGHGLYYVLVQRHPVAQVMPWLLLSPVLAVALGIAFWGDRPGPRLWLGGAMVLGGVLVVALRALAKARTAPAPTDA